jgi:hypothetical protein
MAASSFLFGDIGLFSGFRALLRRQAGDIP